jgi:hypothetical protein
MTEALPWVPLFQCATTTKVCGPDGSAWGTVQLMR